MHSNWFPKQGLNVCRAEIITFQLMICMQSHALSHPGDKPFACKYTQTIQATFHCETNIGCKTAANQMSETSIGIRGSSETIISLSLLHALRLLINGTSGTNDTYTNLKFLFWNSSHHWPGLAWNENLLAWHFNLPCTQLANTSITSRPLLQCYKPSQCFVHKSTNNANSRTW